MGVTGNKTWGIFVAALLTSVLCGNAKAEFERIFRAGFEPSALQPGATQLVARPNAFLTNSPTQVRFQVRLLPSAGLTVSRVDLYRATSTGTVVGAPLCDLRDNGLLSNGDDIGGDSVYSCLVTLTESTPKELFLVSRAVTSQLSEDSLLG